MSAETKRRGVLQVIINRIRNIKLKTQAIRSHVNNKMRGRYSPHGIALMATLGIILIWFIMLMLTPAKGLADDGSLGDTLAISGLSYLQENPDEIYNNYFVRTYKIDLTKKTEIKNIQDIFIRLAISVDETFVRDSYFDIRFLALIYGLLYFIAIYRLVKSISRELYHFSEAVGIGVLSVIIFGDISYLAYFNSFYPEALWLIGFVYLVGAITELRHKKNSYGNLLLIGVSAMILSLTRWQCWTIAFLAAAFFLRAVFINRQNLWRTACMILAFLMSMTGIITMNALESDFTLTSKFHSMTKGVLFQASNPEVALEEFGINPSYSVLANASAYNYYPFILPDNKQLQAGFMEQYDAFEVTMYYMKNPNAFVRMLDLSIKEAVYLRRDFSGNFEMSAGMPKMSQSIMWSFWSFLKQRSMPKTIGFFTLLLVATLFLLRRSDRRTKSKGDGEYPQIMQVLVLMMVAIGISQSIVSIIMSGDAEFGRRTFLLGMAIDMLLYIFISHLLPKINILDDKEAV